MLELDPVLGSSLANALPENVWRKLAPQTSFKDSSPGNVLLERQSPKRL